MFPAENPAKAETNIAGTDENIFMVVLGDTSLDSVLDSHAARTPLAEACRDSLDGSEPVTHTFEELRATSLILSSAIMERISSTSSSKNLQRPVGVCLDRGYKWYSVYIACIRLGLPVAPMTQDISDLSASSLRNERIVRDLDPVLVITDSSTPASVFAICRLTGARTVSIEELMASDISSLYSEKPLVIRDLQETPLGYVYTGGTTRASKCVKVSHQMAMHEMKGYPEVAGKNICAGDRVLQHSSSYWGATFLGQINIALAFGASVVFCSNAADLSSVIEREKISVLGLVPSQLEAIAGRCESLKTVFTWGEKLSRKTAMKWKNQVALLVELLVSTEYWLCLFALNGEDSFRILNSVDVRILDGQLLIGGDCVTPFGYTEEALNAEAFVQIEGTRYFKSNDLVRFSKEGKKRIEFLGRSDSLIKIGGEWVDLFLIEQSIKNIDDSAVVDCCICQQQVFVLLSNSFTQHTINACRALVNEQYLRLSFVHRLPRNAITGKIDRQKLKQTDICSDVEFARNSELQKRRVSKTLLQWTLLLLVCVSAVCFFSGPLGLLIAPFVSLVLIHSDWVPKSVIDFIPSGVAIYSLLITICLPTVVSLPFGLWGLYLKRVSPASWTITYWVGLVRQLERAIQSTSFGTARRVWFGGDRKEASRIENPFDPFPNKNFDLAVQREAALSLFDHAEIFLTEPQVNQLVSRIPSLQESKSPETQLFLLTLPTSLLEEALARIVQNASAAISAPVHMASSLSAINSLSAVEITNHIRDETGKNVRVSDILKCVSFRDLVKTVESANNIQIVNPARLSGLFKCQLWGWRFPCTWVFQLNPSFGSIHFRSFQTALLQLIQRHPALVAFPRDPSMHSNWMNESLVVFGLLRHIIPERFSFLYRLIGRSLFDSWNAVSVSDERKTVRIGWKGLTFYSEYDVREYLLSKRRHPNFRPPLEVDLITLHPPRGPSRHFVRMFVTHAFSDGSCVVPLLKELNELYSACLENRTPNLSPIHTSGLEIQQNRLENTLCSPIHNLKPDSLYACYNMDMCEEQHNSSFGRIVLLHESFVIVAQAAAKRLSVPIDVLLLSAVVCSLSRLWNFRNLVEMALVVPLRDGPHEADVVGFLADQRNLDVPLNTKFATITNVVQTVHFLRRTRAWTIPAPFSNCQRTLVNIVQATFPDNVPFKQEVLLQQYEQTTGSLYRPMELYIEQVDTFMWSLKARCRMREYSLEKFELFCDIFKNVVTDLLANPNAALHTETS